MIVYEVPQTLEFASFFGGGGLSDFVFHAYVYYSKNLVMAVGADAFLGDTCLV